MSRLSYWLRYDWPLHVIMLLTSWLPDNVIFFRFRGSLARPFIGSCGRNLRLGRHITFYNAGSLHIGTDVYAAIGCVLLAPGEIHIGNEVLLGPYVVVVSGNHTNVDGSFRFSPGENTPIHIGAGTWIGAHTTVLSGANIGISCVIGSNAAVTRGNIPDNSFAAGVPAVIKQRTSDDMSSI